MKKIHLLFACGLTALLLSNCTTMHRIPVASPPQTHVLLKEANYKIVKKVSGEWSTSYVLGLGGTSRSELANNSVAAMIEKAQLKDNQAIINTTTAVSTKYIFGNLYTEINAVTTGYVIEFVGPNSSNEQAESQVKESSSNKEIERTTPSVQQPTQDGQPVSQNSTDQPKRQLKIQLPKTMSSAFEPFQSGQIYNMSKNNKSSYERAFVSEIESDLENAKTMDDLDIINTKIAYLNQYAAIQQSMKSTVDRLKKSLSSKLEEIQ